MNGFAILALIFLAVVGNLLWFWLKNDLQQLGYETHFFRGHFNDLSNALEVIKKTDDPRTKRAYRNVLFSIVAVIIFMPTIFFTNMSTIGSHRCKRFNDYLEYQVQAVIESKFINSYNHNVQTLNLNNGKRETQSPIFVTELYDYLQPNDSISKISGNTELTVYRNGNERTFNVERTDWCNE
ncbi:hypothetical protein [Marinoscillum sp. MHG1-6]|uniref:hypothetical protein n=1 Tax=Marinoscillum sp. MHG1-6 TaxID=2959627 RepID=UPI002157D2D0|nr:hypothetical protein [Marinoscillum sp. MHG1-6]